MTLAGIGNMQEHISFNVHNMNILFLSKRHCLCIMNEGVSIN